MTIKLTGGRMPHSTVENLGPEQSEVSTKTGGFAGAEVGNLAKSSKARLSLSFPGSPIIGTGDCPLTKETVANLLSKLLTNTVTEHDRGDAQGYYGFWAAASLDDHSASSADLSFGGAPNIPGVSKDDNGHIIASPYLPNLVPPKSFSPIEDNQDFTTTRHFQKAKTSRPPFIGDGTANPKASSASVENFLVPKPDGDQPIAPHPSKPASTDTPVGGDVATTDTTPVGTT